MPGYSGTPLAKKLGYTAGARAAVIGAPAEYMSWLDPLPADIVFLKRVTGRVDLVHFFADQANMLSARLPALRKAIFPDGALWISWPKKASCVPTDVTEDRIRELALPLGLVDVKVCAVSDVWSGLKLVIRKELRTEP